MKDCSKFENSIQAVMDGDPRLEQLEELAEHCKTCRACRELFEMHRTLTRIGSKFDELEAVDLSGVRSSIVRKIAVRRKAHSLPGWIAVLRTPFRLQPITAVLLLAVFFGFGLIASRLGGNTVLSDREMTAEILSSMNPGDLTNSLYSFSNVAVTPLDDNRISLSFDITRRVEIVDSSRSSMVKGVLTNSVLNPSRTGVVGYFRNESVAPSSF